MSVQRWVALEALACGRSTAQLRKVKVNMIRPVHLFVQRGPCVAQRFRSLRDCT
jgi:hypothetical protein